MENILSALSKQEETQDDWKKYSSVLRNSVKAFSFQKLDTLQNKQGKVIQAACFLTFELNSRETSWCTDISLVICKSQCCTPAWLLWILLHFQILWTKTGFGKKPSIFRFYTYDLHIYSEFLSQLAVFSLGVTEGKVLL